MEEWKDIDGYGGDYRISSFGRVQSFKKQKNIILVNKISGKSPYQYVCLSSDGFPKNFYIHRLVAMSFIPNKLSKKEVNHIDGNKQNNLLDNLEWVTAKENTTHAIKTGLAISVGENHGASKLDNLQSLTAITLLPINSGVSIAKHFNVKPDAISCIKTMKNWKHLPRISAKELNAERELFSQNR